MPGYYPVFLDLTDRPCLVVGGGRVAERKVAGLSQVRAAIRVISPQLTDSLTEQAARGAIDWVARSYHSGDLEGAFLAIAATDDAAVNAAVADEAGRRGCLVAVVDDPDRGDWIAPAVLRRGDLTIAVSTGGRSPRLARQVRDDLADRLPADYGEQLAQVAALRERLRRQLARPSDRAVVWEQLLEAGLLDLIAQHQEAAVGRLVADLVARRVAEAGPAR